MVLLKRQNPRPYTDGKKWIRGIFENQFREMVPFGILLGPLLINGEYLEEQMAL